ncbi:hypothetical protein GCM10009741_61380 [Kribbella lupini]|uniref:Response regulatory domain-containing protein n=1 Tax=Kribbella lupini TaxID=291602 RepID=A0ABN2BX67_9ACTN
MIRVLLADDQALVRAFAVLVNSADDMGQADSWPRTPAREPDKGATWGAPRAVSEPVRTKQRVACR